MISSFLFTVGLTFLVHTYVRYILALLWMTDDVHDSFNLRCMLSDLVVVQIGPFAVPV